MAEPMYDREVPVMTLGEARLLKLLSAVARMVRRGKLSEDEVRRGVWLDFVVNEERALTKLRRSLSAIELERVG